jgi:hypothetical protein
LPVWARAWARGIAEASTTTDVEHDCCADSDPILQAIMKTPAETVEDMAIKSYLSVHYELGADTDDKFGIDWKGGLMTDASPHRAMIADAIRLSPTLASVLDSGLVTAAA